MRPGRGPLTSAEVVRAGGIEVYRPKRREVIEVVSSTEEEGEEEGEIEVRVDGEEEHLHLEEEEGEEEGEAVLLREDLREELPVAALVPHEGGRPLRRVVRERLPAVGGHRRRLGQLVEAQQRRYLIQQREERRRLQQQERVERRAARIRRQQHRFEEQRLRQQQEWAIQRERDRCRILDLPTRSR